jgi:hypothetical protein
MTNVSKHFAASIIEALMRGAEGLQPGPNSINPASSSRVSAALELVDGACPA